MTTRTTTHFLRTEAGAGLWLGLSALIALVWANSAWRDAYAALLHVELTLGMGSIAETHSLSDWIKEGLMALFFFVVGLEIKQEVVRGELSDPRKLALPIIGAVGGVVVPAGLYWLINMGPGGDPRGWSAPVATDIAFALAALAAVGRGLPASLRIFLMTLAIVDDIGAVIIIGVAYSGPPSWGPVAGAIALLGLMAGLGLWRRAPAMLWLVGFLAVWAFVLKSGISTSLAGVAAALTVPVGRSEAARPSPLNQLMDALHPWTAYLVLPAFAFSAAGMNLSGIEGRAFGAPTIGVIVGLVIGKTLGVGGASLLAIKSGLARRPAGATWPELLGVALLCGVGFTMSLFITSLAFEGDEAGEAAVKLGVLAGSALAMLAGMVVLFVAARQRTRAQAARREALGGPSPAE